MSRRAFSFVERITQIEPGVSAQGLYQVPNALERFPPSLVTEAVGQLAAWVAMEHLDYRLRPVAGIAAEARFFGEAQPGETLELSVEIESCSDSDVAYSGRAQVAGTPVVELRHCLGPMLPMTTFDDPGAVRERFALLCEAGLTPNGFGGVVEPTITSVAHRPGEYLEAELQVPQEADFFADHFPRRAVFPATLLLDAQLGLVCRLADEAAHGSAKASARVRRARDVKMRSFIAPGQRLDVQIRMAAAQSDGCSATLTTRSEGRRVASARAEIEFQENG